jgi:HSP20 family protein
MECGSIAAYRKEESVMAFNKLVPWKKQNEMSRREDRSSDPFTSLQREMNRLFDQFTSGLGFDMEYRGQPGTWAPMVNVSENDKEVLVEAELPGIDEKNVEVTLTNDTLTIRGEKKEEKEEKGKNFYRMERSFGSFHRDIALPNAVETEKVDATFKNGVLTVRLPKSQQAQKDVKKIDVKKT